jgi:RNA polymerase sigma-70 factor (ECF subfamily)
MLIFYLALAVRIENEEDVIRRLKNGDSTALGEVYDAFSPLVYRLIVRIVRDPGAAEELLQETFLKLWKRADLLNENSGSLGPWIVTIARNRALDYLDSTGNRIGAHVTQLASLDRTAVFSSLDRHLLSAVFTRELREAVGRLNKNQRTVIELAYYEGLSHSEMVTRLNQPLGTVKGWVRGALQTLRSDLEGRKAK